MKVEVHTGIRSVPLRVFRGVLHIRRAGACGVRKSNMGERGYICVRMGVGERVKGVGGGLITCGASSSWCQSSSGASTGLNVGSDADHCLPRTCLESVLWFRARRLIAELFGVGPRRAPGERTRRRGGIEIGSSRSRGLLHRSDGVAACTAGPQSAGISGRAGVRGGGRRAVPPLPQRIFLWRPASLTSRRSQVARQEEALPQTNSSARSQR
jgi:hypothetical protein